MYFSRIAAWHAREKRKALELQSSYLIYVISIRKLWRITRRFRQRAVRRKHKLALGMIRFFIRFFTPSLQSFDDRCYQRPQRMFDSGCDKQLIDSSVDREERRVVDVFLRMRIPRGSIDGIKGARINCVYVKINWVATTKSFNLRRQSHTWENEESEG